MFLFDTISGKTYLLVVIVFIALEPVSSKDEDTDGIYWCVDYPWPMSDRNVFLNSFTHVLKLR